MLKARVRRLGGKVLRRLGLRKPAVPLPSHAVPPGEAFVEAIRARYGMAPGEEPADETMKMWFNFSLSSLGRGRYAVEAMGGRPAFEGRRVLDVGCAYGGFLVAAHEAGATEVTGIDVNPELLALARLQLGDHRVEGRVELRDITQPIDDLGRFDVILCNDVLEHVTDPVAAAANLAAVLVPGGSVFLNIPNGWAVDFMHKDGHYGLFGITLLDRARAEQLWSRTYSGAYGVEHYAPLTFYLDIFSRAGLAVRLINPLPDDLDAAVAELARRFDDLEERLAALEPDEGGLTEEMRRRGGHEIERFRHLAGLHGASLVAAERDVIARSLWNTYGLTFWELVATRPR